MTMLDGALPKTKQSVANFLHWKFPDLKRLENLRALQTEERRYLDSMERNGASGRAVEYLRSMLETREMEIRALQANGRFPAQKG
jgi:hypothetical protein